MNTETSKDIIASPNSKIEIIADNYNKTKVFNVQDGSNQRFSRVDSQNYPDATDNLDYLAQKMGFNHQSNKSTPAKLDHNILDQNSEEKLSEKGLSKSFQVSSEKPLKIQPNKISHKKAGFMSNIIRRLSISTPKIFSKNKKHKKSKTNGEKVCVDNKNQINKNIDLQSQDKSYYDDKLTNGVDENHSQFSPKSKTIRKILKKFGKKKGGANITSEPPSSIDSRPSLSSVANHGVNIESAISCNDIFLNKICKTDLQKHNSSSADCILDFQNRGKPTSRKESGSSISEDHEAKLNTVDNVGQNGTFHDELPDLEIPAAEVVKDDPSPLSVKPNEFQFDTQKSCHSTMSASYQAETSHNVKLTLALYGYCNYGLSSSRLTSKSCMEFRASNASKKIKLSAENIPCNQKSKPLNCDKKEIKPEKESEVTSEKIIEAHDTTDSTDKEENKVAMREKEDCGKNDDQSVVLRKSKRPIDIKLRKSREPNPNLVARSSMIMLVVSHNSPRSKVISTQLSTPNKELDLNSSLNGTTNIPAMKLNFDGLSLNDNEKAHDDETRKSGHLSASFDGNKLNNITENGFSTEPSEILDGNYFLNMVHKYENDIQLKIDVVQKYLDNPEIEFDDEVSGQLMVTVGKAKLLLSEKMLQFKGLCEKNIRGIIEEHELPTLVSDLNGFWDMVFGQVEDINKNFVLVEQIRMNNWKMIPFENDSRISSNTPSRSKISSTSKSLGGGSGGHIRKVSNNNTPTPKKKSVSNDTPAKIKLSAEKRKNMMLFKMNQKASMIPNSDPNFCNDITFY